MKPVICAIVLAGCITSQQDGHFDVCHKNAADYIAITHLNTDYYNGCDYHPWPRGIIEDESKPSAYERGLLNGFEDCWAERYDDGWLALEAQENLCPGIGPLAEE